MGDRAHDIAGAVGALIAVIYVVTSFEIGERYPFARFRMFQDLPGAASRVVARDAAGDVHELARFVDWRCPAIEALRFDGPGQSCRIAGSYPEIDQRAAGWVRDHAAPDATTGEDIDIVRRTYFFRDRWGAPEHHDCVVATCRATRAP